MNKLNVRKATLKLEALETRLTPAYISGGNLEIVGSSATDTVKVTHVYVNSVERIRVTHNGSTQDFTASAVTGKVRFWGYAGNDRFDYYGTRACYADGGAGNDFLSADQGADLLIGGDGHDTIEGWGGADELQGGYGDDVLDGGSGNDLLFGQAGADTLGGGSGDDRIVGGTGTDIAFGGTGYDQFWECNDVAYFYVPVSTRFGTAYGAGVQDATSVDRVWS